MFKNILNLIRLRSTIITHGFDGNLIQNGQTATAADFITKSQRNATKSNDSGRGVRMESDGYVDAEMIKNVATFAFGEAIDGTTTPQACFKAGDSIYLSEGDVAARNQFYGFVKQDVTGTSVQFLNGTNNTGTGTTFSHTVNAGNDVLVLVRINYALVGSTSAPTGVTWNSNTMTLLHEEHGSRSGMSVYYYKAGDVASNTTGDVVITGGSTPAGTMAVNFENVDQTDTFADENIVAATSGNSITNTVTTPAAKSVVIHSTTARHGNTTTNDSDVTLRYNDGASIEWSDAEFLGAGEVVLTATHTGGAYDATERGVASAIVLNSATSSEEGEIWHAGIVHGFTSLTEGADYYLDTASGAIATDGDGEKVGIAVAADAILIERPPRFHSALTSDASGRIELGWKPRKITATGGRAQSGYADQTSRGVWYKGNYYCVYGDNSTGQWGTNTGYILRDGNDSTMTVTVDETGFNYSGNSSHRVLWEIEE
jgi:hypothetical protein